MLLPQRIPDIRKISVCVFIFNIKEIDMHSCVTKKSLRRQNKYFL